ncbi:MAG: sugar ABC transporter permease [Rhodospirillales bacterium 70-18]|nr:sugar ABC transporter permease [Rhodospirillales bacterium]OJY78424.1 MAG: sugar ABC transporter permease [Rhodospirillales bacterium 70-18]
MSGLSPGAALALPPAGGQARRRRSLGQRLWSTGPVLVLFLPPALLLFTALVVVPILDAGRYSFFDWSGYGVPTRFIGWRNFDLIWRYPAFHQALLNNLLIIAVSLCIQLPMALGLASLVASRIRGAVTFRMIFFLPYILADVAAGLIWRFMYDGDYGLAAAMAHVLGLPAPYVLADPHWAMTAVLVVIVWKYFGFHMMLFIAGLQGIDPALLDAAAIDGANRLQRFRRVTLPLLTPTIRLSVFFSVIGSLQLFDLIMPLTKGGPEDSTQTLVTFLYSFGIMRMRVGFGSAVGVVLFVICVVFAFGYKRLAFRDV